MNHLISIKDYLKYRFKGENKPSERSVRRWIKYGYLPGKMIDGIYYVDIVAENELIITGDPEIDKLIWDMSNKQELVEKHQDFVRKYLNRIPMYLKEPLIKNNHFLSH